MKKSRTLSFTGFSPLAGAMRAVVVKGLLREMDAWAERPGNESLLAEPDFAAQVFMHERRNMPTARGKTGDPGLPTGRRTPATEPWRFAYLITGEKKIGKTTFAIQGTSKHPCEEFVFQFDKPQVAIPIREEMIRSWGEFKKWMKRLEAGAASGRFPYTRIVVDGVDEWYQRCMEHVCAELGIDHPDDGSRGKGWNRLRCEFRDMVSRLLALQVSAQCGIVLLAHSQWLEEEKSGRVVKRTLRSNLTGQCSDIVNAKVDAWFNYDYVGDDRVLWISGNDEVRCGHRIDGHFRTTDGRYIKQIYMGTTPKEGMENFMRAFDCDQTYADVREFRGDGKPRARSAARRRVVRRGKDGS